MNQWTQVVFENNTITGISPISGGQSVGTGPGGGYDHHIYHARNRIQFVWGNDREIITCARARVCTCLPACLPACLPLFLSLSLSLTDCAMRPAQMTTPVLPI